MYLFNHKKKSVALPNGLMPCLSGEILLVESTLKHCLTEIKNLINCPNDIYQQLYLTTLLHLAEFCQSMPFSSKTFSQNHGLIERQLKLAAATLKLRRGYLLPKNADTETIALEEARWTYALFSAGLLTDIHQIQRDREIMLHYENGDPIGVWSPLAGSLYEKNIYYSIKFISKPSVENTDVFMAAVSGRIIPVVAFRWLFENAALFKLWWETLLNAHTTQNEIVEIIQNAAKKLEIDLLNTHFQNSP